MPLLNILKGFSRRAEHAEQESDRAQSSGEGPSFYRLAETCQIANLDTLYASYFGERVSGCFVEVGAFDGEYVSNTSGLADIGWSGFYIEPVKEHVALCRARHANNPNVQTFHLAIGDCKKTDTITVAGPLSTMDNNALRTFKELPWAEPYFADQSTQTIEQVTLGDFLSDRKVPKNFELLVIDVEGYEWKVLKNFDLRKWLPQMVIIELHDQNPDYADSREESERIVEYFEDHAYRVIQKDLTNTIYVPRESRPGRHALESSGTY